MAQWAVSGEAGDGAHVAQLVEHVLGKDEVSGSIPLVGSSLRRSGAKAKAARRRPGVGGLVNGGVQGYGWHVAETRKSFVRDSEL